MKSLFWIFVIYSIFKRLKGISKPEKQITDVPKIKDEEQLYFPEGKETDQWLESDVTSQFDGPNKMQEVKSPVLMDEEKISKKIKQETTKEITKETTCVSIEGHEDNDLDFDSDALREGVLWAEILEPPRAKRPFGFKNYN